MREEAAATVSGLVVTWGRDARRASEARRLLAAEPGCTLGDEHGPRQAVVLESSSAEQAEETFRRIGGWPGVAAVHLTCVYFEDDDSGSGGTAT